MRLSVPSKIFFTKGLGTHKDKQISFEYALRDAGIEKFNLVHVSSILPPNCEIISPKEGLKLLKPGEIVFSVFSHCCSNEPRRMIAASIGCAIPCDRNHYGYLSEYKGFGQTEKEAGEYAEELAASMLASTLGIEFDEDKSWDEKKEVYKISNKIVRASSITQSAIVKDGYCTVIAAAIFII